MKDLDSHTRIVVNHFDLFEYQKGDKISEVAAIVTLVKSGAAKQTDIAQAFDISRLTVSRYVGNVEEYGVAGLYMTKTGPQSPHKITPKIHQFIVHSLNEKKKIVHILKDIKDKFDLTLHRKSIERIHNSIPQKKLKPVKKIYEPAILIIAEEVKNEEELIEEELVEGELVEEGQVNALEVKEAISSKDSLSNEDPKEGPAGMFFVWAFLQLLGFEKIVDTTFNAIKGRLFFVRESLLTIILLVLQRCRSIEDYKMLEKRDLGMFWEGCRGMDLRTLRSKLHSISLQNKSIDFLTQLAKRYQETDFIQVGVLYFDGHFIPYHGKRNLHKGFFTQRRLVVPGQEQFWLNDFKGRPFFFWQETGNISLLTMIPSIVKEIKKLTGQEKFSIVFDRGGFCKETFRKLDKEGIKFFTYLRGNEIRAEEEGFNKYSIEYRHRNEDALLAELGYIGMNPEHYRLVMRKKGEKQTPILTNEWDMSIDKIATIMFNRWGQENCFKYMVREYHLNGLNGYLTEEVCEEILVKNPERGENREKKKELEKELQKLEHFLADTLGKDRKHALSKKMKEKVQSAKQRVSEIKEAIKQLNICHKELPEKVSASQSGDNRRREILIKEKKMIVDSLKLLAYNAEEWLLDILTKKYNDYRDFHRVLLMILKQPGKIQRIDGSLVIRLNSFHNPRYQKAATHLCDEINQMNIPAPSGKGILRFKVEDLN